MTHSTGQPPAPLPAFPNIHGSAFAEEMRQLEISIPDPWNVFSSTLADQSQSSNDRFASLYGMLQILNRQYRYDEYRDLVKHYQSHFGGEPYFQTFRALAARGDGTNDKDLHRAARYAEIAVQKLPDRPGVLHQYASIIADLTEAMPRSQKKEIVEKALRRVDEAIDTSPINNANFHYTKARLLREFGQSEEAIDEIQTALSLQNATTDAGIRRIARFESLRARIQIDLKQAEITKLLDDAQQRLNNARSEQIQLLGILAAVIALITTAVTLTTKVDTPQGLRFILVSTGAVVVAFSTLIASYGTGRIRRVIAPVILGCIMIAFGIAIKSFDGWL